MQCPKCASAETGVYETRKRHTIARSHHVYRRRECRQCGHCFTTVEALVGQEVEPSSPVTREDIDALNRHWLQFTNSVTHKLKRLTEKSKQIET